MASDKWGKPEAADWMLEEHARGERVSPEMVAMRAMALHANYESYRSLQRGIARREARRTELARRRAPVWILDRYSEELEILRRALEVVERGMYNRLAAR